MFHFEYSFICLTLSGFDRELSLVKRQSGWVFRGGGNKLDGGSSSFSDYCACLTIMFDTIYPWVVRPTFVVQR